jgi:magnesium-transporting ATPase (P-type)
MKISDILDSNLVEVRLKSRRIHEVVWELLGVLKREGKLKDFEKAAAGIREKEGVPPSIIGGAAIFHFTVDGVTEPVASLGVSTIGIDFKPLDPTPIHIVFLLLSPPEESETHLQLLARAEGLLRNKEFRKRLVASPTREKLFGEVLEAESKGWDAFVNLSINEVLAELLTSPEGISEEEAQRRLKRFGPNLIERTERRRLILRFTSNLTNLFAILLWIAGGLAFISKMPQLGFAIFIVIFINAVFSFWQEYRAEKAIEALRRLIPSYARVLRGGVERRILASEIVPGDVVFLEAGDKVPADGRLIEAFDMRVDNSVLTGESEPLYKTAEPVVDGKSYLWTDLPNLVFGGTSIMSGYGRAIVIATGMHSELGKIARLTQAIKTELSPLQREMVKVTKIISVLAITMGILFFFLGNHIARLSPLESFIFAIGIIVANVPEGLLPTVTLALAMATQRMAKRGVIIKRLSSVETLGCTTVICTDKTGTITTNQMSVVRLWFDHRVFEVTGSGYDPRGEIIFGGVPLSREDMEELGMAPVFRVSSLCNNAEITQTAKDHEAFAVSGDPTEGALLVFVRKVGFDYGEIRRENPRLYQLSFDSVRKRMSTINECGGRTIASVKGAPRELLALSTSLYSAGRAVPLTEEARKSIEKVLDGFAEDGLRVLGLALKEVPRQESYTAHEVERELTFVAVLGFMDPPRPEVPRAVELSRSAGIRIIMITGDYGPTALSVARSVGIARGQNATVVLGEEVEEMDDGRLEEVLRGKELIFARISPRHKLRIVETLRAMGEVVAVTGDGINDAPALKRAHVGIAMGIRGSDVAKESASIIIANDNFASIVAGVEEGRAIYSNIRKFITYILTSNVPEIVPFVLFVLFKIPLPLTIMQILAVDLGTDLIPALGLGAERPEPGVMSEPPRSLKKRLLDFPLLGRAYGFLGIIEASACMAGYLFAYYSSGWKPGMDLASSGDVYVKATAMCLAGIVAVQIGNVFACRTEKESVFKVGLLSNRLILIGIASEIALILMIVYLPALQRIFHTYPLGVLDWAVLAVFAPFILAAEEVRKFLLRLTRQSA